MELMDPVLKGGCTSWDPKVRTEWWILWRRLAGGLPRKTQAALFKSIVAELGPKGSGAASANELTQMWMLAASLERVAVASKRDLAEGLVSRVEEGHAAPPTLWCVGRLGARVPIHGGFEGVVPLDRVEAWISRLLALPKKRRDHYALALMLLARRTDDRSRDIDDELRDQVIERLREEKATSQWVRAVAEVVEDEPLDTSVLGESLPPGLRLMG